MVVLGQSSRDLGRAGQSDELSWGRETTMIPDGIVASVSANAVHPTQKRNSLHEHTTVALIVDGIGMFLSAAAGVGNVLALVSISEDGSMRR